ncbi:MAG TPA: hypothetical protein PLJ74_13555 [Myxococcota bacterium]|nr:hypothetical protein [Myxococcota bacterium]
MATQSNPNVIDSIPEQTTSDSMSLEFKGQAYQILLQLRSAMRDAKSESDVIVRAIALLTRAKGKDIHIVDPKTGDIEIVNLWK